MAEFWASTYGFALSVLLQGLAIIAFVMGSLIFLVYGDRKIWAAVQMRRGPNVSSTVSPGVSPRITPCVNAVQS